MYHVVASRTCQVSSELSMVSAEVVELNLRCQEDVLGFRKREHTLVCAGVLMEQQSKQRGVSDQETIQLNY